MKPFAILATALSMVLAIAEAEVIQSCYDNDWAVIATREELIQMATEMCNNNTEKTVAPLEAIKAERDFPKADGSGLSKGTLYYFNMYSTTQDFDVNHCIAQFSWAITACTNGEAAKNNGIYKGGVMIEDLDGEGESTDGWAAYVGESPGQSAH